MWDKIIYFIFALLAFYLGYHFRKYFAERKLKTAEEKARQTMELAKKDAETRKREAELEAKELLLKLRQDFEKETKDRRAELAVLEKRLLQKEGNLERRVELLERKEREISQKGEALTQRINLIKKREEELDVLLQEEKERLQRVSSLSPQQAKELLLKRIEEELKEEKARAIKKMEQEIREAADKKAKETISLAIQRCAAEHTVESTVSVVSLPSDEMKGRIIGREGRNIRALEMATGIDVIIDDTPEAVILSGFDMFKREIARAALERLIADGRIHPGRIEEVVEKAKREMEVRIREEGERAAFEVGIHNLHPELIRRLGRLKFRTSFGQNVLQHSKEVSLIMGALASELGLNTRLAQRIGLLHDIGKSARQDIEGTHARIGAELAAKFGESQEVVHAIQAHHEEIEPKSLYGVLSVAADAISAVRPGARRETLETYVKRLEKLEQVASLFKGVEKAYAIQAGREVRVIVQPDRISDSEALNLAREIRKKIEEGLEYPGQIKVTVIRETRAIEYAK